MRVISRLRALGVATYVCGLALCVVVHPLLAEDKREEARRHYQLALSAIGNDDYQTAVAEFSKAIDLDSGNAILRYQFASLLAQQDKSQEALTHLKLAIGLGLPDKEKNEADVLLARLESRTRTGPHEEAIFQCGATDLNAKCAYKVWDSQGEINFVVEAQRTHAVSDTTLGMKYCVVVVPKIVVAAPKRPECWDDCQGPFGCHRTVQPKPAVNH